jgi:hypothetical protein
MTGEMAGTYMSYLQWSVNLYQVVENSVVIQFKFNPSGGGGEIKV